jgi:aryl-alcohol dehydrogenase-like predicted oxidoreductase
VVHLAELKAEGLVRHLGGSNFEAGQLRRAQAIAPVDVLQPPYSLVAPDVGEELLPFAEQQGIGVIANSPRGSGLLPGRMTRERIAALPDNEVDGAIVGFRRPDQVDALVGEGNLALSDDDVAEIEGRAV